MIIKLQSGAQGNTETWDLASYLNREITQQVCYFSSSDFCVCRKQINFGFPTPTKSSDYWTTSRHLRQFQSLQKRCNDIPPPGTHIHIKQQTYHRHAVIFAQIWSSSAVCESVSNPPPTETHNLFSWIFLIKSNCPSSPTHPEQCLWSVSKCWWAALWTDSPRVFLLLLYNVSHTEGAHVPWAPDISHALMQPKSSYKAAGNSNGSCSESFVFTKCKSII